MDTMQLIRLNGAILNNDVEACYDRMIPELTALHLQSLRMSDNTNRCSVLIIKNMKQHINTADGISKDRYRHTEDFSNWGEGKGKGSSPVNWQLQSSTLLAALTALCVGAGLKLMSTSKKFIADWIGKAYIDDADNVSIDQTTHATDTPTSMNRKMTKIAQTWEQLLFGYVGKLSIKKLLWYLLWWIWENGKPHLATKEEHLAEVLISEGRSIAKITLPHINLDVLL
eukprot:12037803-Ditylum_brightwellii.AAC.1